MTAQPNAVFLNTCSENPTFQAYKPQAVRAPQADRADIRAYYDTHRALGGPHSYLNWPNALASDLVAISNHCKSGPLVINSNG